MSKSPKGVPNNPSPSPSKGGTERKGDSPKNGAGKGPNGTPGQDKKRR